MALSPSLQQFKSSGVYRLEFDKSQITNIPSETIRLIIGFSKKGPFNTPVFVQDNVFFKDIFGDIDTTLERKGSFFHRTALTCLDRGPVIVLNLLNLDDVLDTSNFQSISTCATDVNGVVDSAPVSSFFNKDKFWFTDPAALISSAAANQSLSQNRLLNFSNVGRKPISVITRKSDVLGFDVLAKDWFGVGKVPFWMNENDYVTDYMIDVIVVEGDFSSYTTLAIDPIFGPYFDATGVKKTIIDQFGFERDGLTSFLALPQVNVLGVYTGAMIPEFQDKNGNNVYIQDLVNLETSKTGLLMALNPDAFDDDPFSIAGESRRVSGDLIDTVGHTLESNPEGIIEFLSYYGSIQEDLVYRASNGATAITIPFIVSATAGTTGAQALYTASTALTSGGTGWTSVGGTGYYDTLTIYGPASSAMPTLFTSYFTSQAQFEAFASTIAVGKSFLPGSVFAVGGATGNANYIGINSKELNLTTNTLTVKIPLTQDSTSTVAGPTSTSLGWYYIGGAGVTNGGGTATATIIRSNAWKYNDTGATAGILAGQDSDIYQANLNGLITDGDRIAFSATGFNGTGATFTYVEFTRGGTNNFSSGYTTQFNGVNPIFNRIINFSTVSSFLFPGLTGSAQAIPAGTTFAFRSYTGNINESLEVDATLTPADPTTTIWLDNSANGPLGLNGYNGKIIKGQYLVQNFGGTSTPTNISPLTGKSRLTRIISVVQYSNPLDAATYQKIKVTTNDPIYVNVSGGIAEVERYQDIRNFVEHYRFSSLNGYALRDAQMPNGTGDRQNAILDVMYNSNIAQALEDREVITFRYIVDSFQGLIEPASKIRLTKLAKNRQSALAICNMPSVKQFKDSTNPLFKFDTTQSFDTQYVPTGGNLNLNPSNIFNLPGIADGANYAGFYGPNLVIRENGSNVSVPPAGHVSNLFIDKYTLALPYSIVAGPRRGVVTGAGLVGVEYNFDRTDLDWIEPFGYNAIVNKRGFGLTINANQTAQQTVKSALSQVHVRELLIYIQDGIEAILKNYRWEFNTAQNRLEIKTLADNFLSQVLADGGVYDFQNIMDSTNNTNEVIDNNIGILDTYIEPVRGMGILVHRTTILRTGTIATGNFL
jgi:hypothetical protein